MISNWSRDWSHYSILVFFHRKVQHYYGYLDYEIDFKIIEKIIIGDTYTKSKLLTRNF